MKRILFALLAATGALTVHADLFQYSVSLNGAIESPVNASPGTGTGSAVYDSFNHTLQLQVSFSGLMGNVTASHIHAPTPTPFGQTAGVATTTPTFAGFPSGVTSGSFTTTLDLTSPSSYNPAFVTANGGAASSAEAALAGALAGGQAYWNIHSSSFPGGEIRGFFVASVPEPGTLALAGVGAVGLLLTVARRKALAGQKG